MFGQGTLLDVKDSSLQTTDIACLYRQSEQAQKAGTETDYTDRKCNIQSAVKLTGGQQVLLVLKFEIDHQSYSQQC